MSALHPIVSSSSSPCPTTPRAHAPAPAAGPCDTVCATPASPRAAVNPRAHAPSPPFPPNSAAAPSSPLSAAPSPAATLLGRFPVESFAHALVRDLRFGLARYGIDGDEQITEEARESSTSEDSSDEGVGEALVPMSVLEDHIRQDLQRAQATPPPGIDALQDVIAELDKQEAAQAAAIAYTEAVARADQKLDDLTASLLFCGVRLGEAPQSAPLSPTELQRAVRLSDVLHAARPVLEETPLRKSLEAQDGDTPRAMVAQVALRGLLILQDELLSEVEMGQLEAFYRTPEAECILRVKEAIAEWTFTACEATAMPWVSMLNGIVLSRSGDQMLGIENAQGALRCNRVFTAPGAPADAAVVPFVR